MQLDSNSGYSVQYVISFLEINFLRFLDKNFNTFILSYTHLLSSPSLVCFNSVVYNVNLSNCIRNLKLSAETELQQNINLSFNAQCLF